MTQDELDQLYGFDFSDNPKLERVRDLFVLQCSTGLRISDLKRIGPDHIEGDVIKMRAFKTGKKIFVPLTQRSFEILLKYDLQPPRISDQKLNEYIKIACQRAKIDSQTEIYEYKAGMKIIKKVPKWELITSHVGVKTFITHCDENEISAKVVAEITGKTVKVIYDHYLGTSEQTIRKQMYKGFGEPKIKVVR